MRVLNFLFFLFFLISCSISFNEEGLPPNKKVDFEVSKVIYGSDDRVEIDDWDGRADVKALAKTVLSLYRETSEKPKSNKLLSPLCEEEPFRNQKRDALCTGLLIAPDLVVTAGHCLKRNNECKSFVWRFDYPLTDTGSEYSQKTYRCSHVIRPKDYYKDKKLDFVFIKLSEPVLDRRPFSLLEESQDSVVDEGVFAIGNPSGFPLKIMKGKVTEKGESELFFQTNIDSYRGNSGSPIFTEENSRLIGLLVSGEKDFEFDPLRGCYYSKKCLENEEPRCGGETALSISKVYESYKWILETKRSSGEKIFSHFDSFEKACSSNELNDPSRYFLSLLEEKTRSQNCSVINDRMKRARYLDLNSSFIENPNALLFFNHIQFLNLENNKIKDFKFLNSFLDLKSLYLKGNGTDNKLTVDNLKYLNVLSVSQGSSLISSIKKLSNLSSLAVESVDNRFLQEISDLWWLKKLNIENSDLPSLGFLKKLNNLETLSLQNNQLKDISLISEIPSLRSLDLSQNLIEDFSPLYSLEKLYSFRAEKNPVKVCPLDSLSFSMRKFCEKSLSP